MKKKILLIIPEMMMGGAQRSLSKLSFEFSKQHTVWLVIFNRKENIAYTHGGDLISLDVESGEGLFNKTRSFIQRVNRLRKLKKDLGIDVSVSFLEGADYINILSRVKDKIILSVRGSKRYDETIAGNFSWLRNKILIPWLYRYSDHIVTVNYGIATELRTTYKLRKVKISTIGNFYDIEEITRLSLEPKEANVNRLYNDPILITSGRLAPEKGLDRLIHVFHQLKKENQKLRFVIMGDGSMLSELVSIANQLNLSVHHGGNFEELPDILFLGNQLNVYKFLKGATLFLMNSSSEGFPNGLAEAMICGVPVVSSDCPYGPREILASEILFESSFMKPHISPYGVLMPIISSREGIKVWAETLNDLLKEKKQLLQLAEQAHHCISARDRKSIISQWYDLLEP